MKVSSLAFGALLASALVSPASAETWVARCNNLQFNFDRSQDRLTVYSQSRDGLNAAAQRFINANRGSGMIAHLFQGKIFTKTADSVVSAVPVSNPQPGQAQNNFQVFPRWTLNKSNNTVGFAVKSNGELMTFKFCTSNPPVQVIP